MADSNQQLAGTFLLRAERKGGSLPRIATSVWAVLKTPEAPDGC